MSDTQYTTRPALSSTKGHSEIEDLVDFVLEKTESPVDHWAVAATLESRGMRDVDAVEKFGKRDIFDLADEVYARCRERLAADPPADEEEPQPAWYRRLARFLKLYLRGTFFALPMAVQIVSMLVFGFALWAFLRFRESQATAVAIGTMLSFIVTGGFVQAIGRLGLSYAEQGSHILAKKVCYRLIGAGLVVVLGIGLVWYAGNLLVPHFPHDIILVSLMYYLLLSGLWLFLAVLYTMQRNLAIVLVTAGGVGVIWLVTHFTPWSIYVAHWVGLAATNLLAFLWGHRLLTRRAATVAGELRWAELPRTSILAYSVAPYFAYGVLYFGYLYLDRFVGWSAGEAPLPLIIWFRTAYELGLDWALLSLVLTIALLEYTINEFAAIIIPTQKRFSAFQIAEHNRFFLRFYLRQVLLLAGIAIVSAVVTYRGVVSLQRYDHIKQIRDFFASPITFQVFYWGVLGYGLLVWGLMNGVFFFSLSRPRFALWSIGLATVINALVGFVLSRTLGYWHSVIGMVVGSLIFAVVTTRYALRVFGDLDYYYYSAY